MKLSPTPQKFLVIVRLHIIIAKNTCLHLDEKVNFNHHINKKISKANKGTGILRSYLIFNLLIYSIENLQIFHNTSFGLW